MFKALIKSLRGSSSPELKIYSPNLHDIVSKRVFSEINIRNFIQNIESDKNIGIALKELISNVQFSESEMQLFQSELENSKGIASAMVVQDFIKKSEILENLRINSLPTTSDELNELIQSNKKLREKTETFIQLVNKHKIKLSIVTLTSASVGNYLFQAAHNLSGCYRYEITPSQEYRLICKVDECGVKSKKDFSINENFCNEVCLPYIAGKCDKINCLSRSNHNFKYVCVNLHWYDVLSLVSKKLSSSLGNFFINFFKYAFIFLAVFCTYALSTDLNLVYRVTLSIMVFSILVIRYF